jgi:predicted lipoprotein with Yx(FWY)xxD motif
VSACGGDCLGVWPPVVVDSPPVGGDGIDGALLGSVNRPDGYAQLTYNGWPLYFYAEDAAPEDTEGHDIESFGEDWYLIGPNGERARD